MGSRGVVFWFVMAVGFALLFGGCSCQMTAYNRQEQAGCPCQGGEKLDAIPTVTKPAGNTARSPDEARP
jgi:hypothetical protein